MFIHFRHFPRTAPVRKWTFGEYHQTPEPKKERCRLLQTETEIFRPFSGWQRKKKSWFIGRWHRPEPIFFPLMPVKCWLTDILFRWTTPILRKWLQRYKKIGVNINQIARRVNTMGTVYDADIQELKERLTEIWHIQRSILSNQPWKSPWLYYWSEKDRR